MSLFKAGSSDRDVAAVPENEVQEPVLVDEIPSVLDRVLLWRAFALAAASDEAREVRVEVGFFQTIRAALVKSSQVVGGSTVDKMPTVLVR